jgi:tetratricopeptide (TPR) repeat protein
MRTYPLCCGRPPSPAPLDSFLSDAMSRIIGFMNTGRYAEAERLARTLVDTHPHLGDIWKVYGAALMKQGKNASPMLQRAIQLAPNDPEAYFYLGSALQIGGDVQGALLCYQRATQLHPGYTEAMVETGDALQQLGRLEEAAVAYRRSLELEPELAEVHNNLGNALRDGGQCEQALVNYRRALEIKPHFAEAFSNMGNALRRLGRTREAETCLRRALQIKPHFEEAHNNLGNALRDLGRFDEAAASYCRALTLNPNFADAHSNFGNVLRDLGQLLQAVASYRRALEINPHRPEAHNNLGNVLLDLLWLDEAAASYRQALALKPDYVHAHTALAMVLRQQGCAAAAEESCRKALAISPDSAESIAFLAELHADRGQFAEAIQLFNRALQIDPNLSAAWAGLARNGRMDDDDGSWLAAAQGLVDKALPVRHAIYLRFAIGKYFDDIKNYEQAFHNYKLANELTKSFGARFDRRQLTCNVDRMAKFYDSEWLRRARTASSQSERPIFVVGMPRSGTTLAEQILASHPAVFGAGELPFWNDALVAYEASSTNDAVACFAEDYLRQLADLSADSIRVVDKMPTNYMNLGLINAALPNARIIHMQRNPIDTCLSIYFQNFSIAHAYANDLGDLAYYYGEYLRLMAHWRATLPPGSILDVSYEGLVSQQEAWSRKMIAFLELPWNARCLEFHETSRTVLTPSKWQVRQKMHSASSGRWRNYQKFIAPLEHLLNLTAPQ